MTSRDPIEALILDLLEWVAGEPKPYREVMEAWRTSCPRLPVWEEARERGLLAIQLEEGRGSFVSVTPTGREYLKLHRGV